MDQLNALIDRRAKQRDAEREREAMYAESVRRYLALRQKRKREAWHEFHLSQAQRIERTAASLAAEHRSKAEALAGGELGVVDAGNRLDEEEAAGA
jgi:hypothetical protein